MPTKVVDFHEPVWTAGLGDTPTGPVSLAVTERGLVRVDWVPPERLAASFRILGEALHAPAWLDLARAWLCGYFTGEARDFPVPIDLRGLTAFDERVLRANFQLRRGEVVTYMEMARRAGCEHAIRATGTALGRNPMPIVIPCHRVVRSDGRLNRFGAPGGITVKAWLLTLEGCRVADGRCLAAIQTSAT
jgi:methylated-DNA-[protein]-cysteine S-methyltransferase